jgi:hypothetical protein
MTQATSSLGLIDRIKRGDQDAFTCLFEKYQPRLAVFIHYRMGARLRGLFEKEDAWILEVRRLSLTQVAFYLGAWVLVVAAALVFLVSYPNLSGTAAVAIVAAATAPMAWIGINCWKQGQLRIAIAYLLAFCLLLPTLMLVAMKEWHILAGCDVSA